MKALLVGASLLLILPAAAAAQSANMSPIPLPPPAAKSIVSSTGINGFDQSRLAAERLRRDGAGTPTQRRERAGRLAEMVNSGQCQAAHDTALRERDRVMAERISEVCHPSES